MDKIYLKSYTRVSNVNYARIFAFNSGVFLAKDIITPPGVLIFNGNQKIFNLISNGLHICAFLKLDFRFNNFSYLDFVY